MSTEANRKIIVEGLSAEYYKLVGIVSDFDKNLLTVKGWGVTLGLAALAWGFQNQHYGLFLVASVSGFAFWLIEAVMKRHQMRYYVRMREIEVISFKLIGTKLQDGVKVSTPLIDWSWDEAGKRFKEGSATRLTPEYYGRKVSYTLVGFYPHVFLPHIVTVITGAILFVLGLQGCLNMPM